MNTPQPASDAPLQNILKTASASVRRRKFWLRIVLTAIAIGAVGWVAYKFWFPSEAAVQYVTEAAETRSLVVKVSATGKLQPTNEVDVGSELSGLVEKVFVDDNDRVKRGQVLAQLDLSKLNDQVFKSQAAVRAAEADVMQARATVTETRANLERLRHVAQISGGKVPAKVELDAAEAALLRAEANLASSQAAVAQAAATLKSDQTNLSKASIRSPIDGVVLSRQVEPGQTVAASLQAPVLFTLAENLAQMELQVDVDEADVGQVKEGQKATFTVDAWPGRIYPAGIVRVGYGALETEGVVSYETILTVDNDDLTLRPGMTATAEITTAERNDVLAVPNGALRFTPPTPQQAEEKGTLLQTLLPGPRFRSAQRSRPTVNGTEKTVWILQAGQAQALTVKTGMSDGRYTEITAGALQPGMQVITEYRQPAKK